MLEFLLALLLIITTISYNVVGFTIVSVWIRFIQYWQVLVITRVAGE